jgi:hypothetical protein
VLFGLFHGPIALPWLTQPRDQAAPEEELILRVPLWARWLWVVAAFLCVVGGAMFAWGAEVGLVVAGIGLLDLCTLAVLNGFWMKGRPTISHHAIRVSVALAIFVLAITTVS